MGLNYRFNGENFDVRVQNAIWGFTPGDLTYGWLSDKANNDYELVRKGDTFDWSFQRKKKMTLCVPSWVKNMKYEKGMSIDVYLIHFFDKDDASVNPTPKYTIVFRNVTIESVIERDFRKAFNGSALGSFKEVLMKVAGGAEYPISS